jgi:hypothetical protein
MGCKAVVYASVNKKLEVPKVVVYDVVEEHCHPIGKR